jgi:hypothetical protein
MPTRIFELGSIDSLPEFRVVMDNSGLWPVPVLETRKTRLRVYVEVQRDEEIDEKVWKALGECVIFAGTGAAVAGLLPGGVASMPTFLHMFGSCAASKGMDLTINQVLVQTETLYDEWERWSLAKPISA